MTQSAQQAPTSATVRVFSDIYCPWAYLTTWRLKALLPEYAGRGVRLEWASLSLELVNREATPKDVLDAERPVINELEPALPLRPWSAPEWQWPVTMLPALEALKCAEAQGDAAARDYNWRIRQAFHAESRCVSLRHVQQEVAEEAGLDLERFTRDLDSGRYRARVLAESREGWESLRVPGSPTLVLADGSRHPAPGLPGVELDEQRRVTVTRPADCGPSGDCLDVLRAILDRALALAAAP